MTATRTTVHSTCAASALADQPQDEAGRQGERDGHGNESAAHAPIIRAHECRGIGARRSSRCVGTRNRVAAAAPMERCEPLYGEGKRLGGT